NGTYNLPALSPLPYLGLLKYAYIGKKRIISISCALVTSTAYSGLAGSEDSKVMVSVGDCSLTGFCSIASASSKNFCSMSFLPTDFACAACFTNLLNSLIERLIAFFLCSLTVPHKSTLVSSIEYEKKPLHHLA